MDDRNPDSRRWCGPLLATLTALFAARVAAQALQVAGPVAWLPPAESFQGSATPYPLLAAIQLGLLAAMAWHGARAWRGTAPVRPRRGRALRVVGSLYLAGSLARIAVGLLVPGAPAWFSTWIPAAFHVVLASYLLVAARYHSVPGGTSR